MRNQTRTLARAFLFVGLLCPAAAAQTIVSADGIIQSTTQGLRFPDSFTQSSSAANYGLAPVERSGQEGCWDSDGVSVPCSGTAHDGETQAGVEWPSPRFLEHGDGTVTDRLTGLVWLRDADCFPARTWSDALSDSRLLASGSCGLSDGSAAGDWRLPSVNELASLVDYGEDGIALPKPNPFLGVRGDSYWASTSSIRIATTPSGYNPYSWAVDLSSGTTGIDFAIVSEKLVWPVRGSTAGPAPVEDTGKRICRDDSAESISCSGTGQDGEMQAGIDWPTPRFGANGDGTVVDHLTRLTWLQVADCEPSVITWSEALAAAAALADGSCGLTDGSAAGDWRLPSIKELMSLVDYGEDGPALPSGHPFLGVPSTLPVFWSSTTAASNPENAWWVGFGIGSAGNWGKNGSGYLLAIKGDRGGI